MTTAVLITDFFDLEIENGKLTFSTDVPPGNLSDIPGLLLLLLLPTDSLSNFTNSLVMFLGAKAPLGLVNVSQTVSQSAMKKFRNSNIMLLTC